MVGAASNDYTKIDIPGGQDYNNYFTVGGTGGGSGYYHRGSSPGRATGVICVGSVDALSTEYKATYSNCGPRIDIFAPGSRIISSVNINGTADGRNATYMLNKLSGTSMASPQVTGVLACVLEAYPSMTPAEAKEYIIAYAKLGQLTETGGGLDDYQSLQGAANRYLAYHKERPTEGGVHPKLTYKPRPSSGAVYPRVQRRKV
jgi:subtilisin family serine protease